MAIMKLKCPPYKYIAYIDESGDDGLVKVQPQYPNGSSEWLVLSAVVILADNEGMPIRLIENMKASFKNHQRPDVHFKDLNNAKKLTACRMLSEQKVRCFTVASNKKNMQGYKNTRAATVPTRNWFYCWMMRLLLERVTHFVALDSMKRYGSYQKVQIEYSARGGHSYSQMQAYYNWLRGRPLFLPQGQLLWETMDRDLQDVRRHQDSAGLQLADIVASAFYKSFNINKFGKCEPEYAKLFKPRMGMSDGLISGYGLKIMPKFQDANLLPEQEKIFKFYGYPRQWWAPTSYHSKAVSSASRGQASWELLRD